MAPAGRFAGAEKTSRNGAISVRRVGAALALLVCGAAWGGQLPEELFAKGLNLAEQISADEARTRALSALAAAYAAHDPERARAVAKNIPEGDLRWAALLAVVRGLAKRDPEAALALAEELPDKFYQPFRSQALGAVAVALAPRDLNRAESLARSIPATTARDRALADLALAAVAVEPRRAARIASRCSAPDVAARAMIALLPVLAKRDRNAAQIAMVLAKRKLADVAEFLRWKLLAELVRAGAGADPERAARYAEEVGDKQAQTLALGAAGAALAQVQDAKLRQRGGELFDRAADAARGLPPPENIAALAELCPLAAKFDGNLAARLYAEAAKAASGQRGAARDAAFSALAAHCATFSPARALDAARNIADPLLAARAFRVIAGQASDGGAARAALDAAAKRASKIADKKVRQATLAGLCGAWARISVNEALALAEQTLKREGQVMAIAAILNALAENAR